MGNIRRGNRGGFDRGNRSGGSRFDGRSSGRRFGGNEGSGGRDRDSGRSERRRPREMHEVTCDKCGKQCQVPFKPTEGKPVYCSECFEKKDNSGSRNRDFKHAISNISSEQLDKINLKLDKIIKALDIE